MSMVLTFLKLEDPEVAGASGHPQFMDQMIVESVEFGAHRPQFSAGNMGTLDSLPPGELEPIRVLKQLDNATPKILLHFTRGTGFKQATFSFCLDDPTPRSTQKIVFFEIKLQTVHIVRYTLVGNPRAFRTRSGAVPYSDSEVADVGPLDEFELSYGKIELRWGGVDGRANISMSYDLRGAR